MTLSNRVRGRLASASVAFVMLAGIILTGSPASAEEDPGLWYFTDYGVQQAHDEGYTGQGVKVAVLDGPINPVVPMLSSANLVIKEPSYCEVSSQDSQRRPATTDTSDAVHGTNMVGLIVGNGSGATTGSAQRGVAPGVELLYYAQNFSISEGSSDAWCDRSNAPDYAIGTAEAINQAVADGADIISMSFTTGVTDSLTDAVARANAAGVILVGGVGNKGEPAGGLESMNGILTLQAMDRDGNLPPLTTMPDDEIEAVGPGLGITGTGGDWTSFSLGGGTSDATAIVSGYLAVVKSKYPQATGNQVLQSLIHNTGVDDHELSLDPKGYMGYGAVSLQHMLREDPTQYPDVNPLISKGGGQSPSYEQIFGTPPPSGSPDPVASGASSSDTGFPVWMLVAGGAGALLVALAITAIVLASRRSRKRSPSASFRGPDNDMPPPAAPHI